MTPPSQSRDHPFPRSVPIDTTSFCNLRCSMCGHKDMQRKKGTMEWSLFTKIIDEISFTDKSTRVWMVFFGEALLMKNKKPSIFEMISYAKSAGLQNVLLNSNACLLDKKSAESLVDSGLDGICIGIDAFCKKTYDKIRVGGDYHQVVKNVLDLIEVRNEKKANGLKILIQFIEMEENRDEREDFTRFWLSKGVDVKIREKLSWAGLVESQTVEAMNVERHACYFLMNTMAITNTGDVTTCAADPDARHVVGNVAELSIKEIWNGRLKNLREMQMRGEWDKLPQPCRDCQDWKISYADKQLPAGKPGPIVEGVKRYLSKILHVSGLRKK